DAEELVRRRDFLFFSSRRRHTRWPRDWSSDVCSSDLSREIRNAVEFCDKQSLRMILAGGLEAYKVKDLLRSKGVPVILRPMLTLPLDEDDPYDRLLTQPAELAAAGVKFAFASFDNSFARRLGQNA